MRVHIRRHAHACARTHTYTHTETHINETLVYWEYSYHRKSQKALYFPAGRRRFDLGHAESETMEDILGMKWFFEPLSLKNLCSRKHEVAVPALEVIHVGMFRDSFKNYP